MSSTFVLAAVIILLANFAGPSAAILCYSCTYNANPYGTALSCITSPGSDPQTTSNISCEACQVTVTTSVSDNSVVTLSRGCAVATPSDCCQNMNDLQVRCTQKCSESDLCNSEPYNISSSINNLPRCPIPSVPGHVICNDCLYSGGHADTSCIDRPSSSHVSLISCDASSSECTVKSVRQNTDLSKVFSYQRGCFAKNFQQYGVTIDSIWTTWICRCSADYCNDNTQDGTAEDCHPAQTPRPPAPSTKPSVGGAGSSLFLWNGFVVGRLWITLSLVAVLVAFQ